MNANALHNYSAEQIADRLGELDLIAKGIKEETDALKSEIKRRGVNTARGDSFILSVSHSTTNRLDTRRLKEDLGDALDGYYVASETATIRIKPAPKVMEAAE